ncbi:hypothetical protein [Teredinibacter franksiae]|uniref:hypothetical protein n=1 Tax=Teredinibacter franksiae TaxID=2761453 RepID=UPI001623AE22|nr:hypothetical protein [Teredinibacter franksiae]
MKSVNKQSYFRSRAVVWELAQVVKALFAAALCLFAVGACTSAPESTKIKHAPILNEEEFTGLQSLGDNLGSIQLNYALDSFNGEELTFTSCTAVTATKESAIDPSQFHLLQLMKVNCTAAEYYFAALSNGDALSAFPAAFTESFVKSLPGLAVPNLGGESMENREGTLAEAEPTLQLLNLSGNAAELALAGDLIVNYLIMARGDFDKDGHEDLLLRLDWYINTAFGKGFDLIMLSQTPTDTQPKIAWRK